MYASPSFSGLNHFGRTFFASKSFMSFTTGQNKIFHVSHVYMKISHWTRDWYQDCYMKALSKPNSPFRAKLLLLHRRRQTSIVPDFTTFGMKIEVIPGVFLLSTASTWKPLQPSHEVFDPLHKVFPLQLCCLWQIAYLLNFLWTFSGTNY